MISVEQLHRALGGEITRGQSRRRQVRRPGPVHSAQDRSVAVAPGDNGDEFVVYSFAGDDVIACKDFVRSKLGLPRFGANGNGKIEQRSVELRGVPEKGDVSDWLKSGGTPE